MGESKLVYKDKAGNKLYRKYIKTRGTWQVFGKNAEGRVVNQAGVNMLMRKAGMSPKKPVKVRRTSRFNYAKQLTRQPW